MAIQCGVWGGAGEALFPADRVPGSPRHQPCLLPLRALPLPLGRRLGFPRSEPGLNQWLPLHL